MGVKIAVYIASGESGVAYLLREAERCGYLRKTGYGAGEVPSLSGLVSAWAAGQRVSIDDMGASWPQIIRALEAAANGCKLSSEQCVIMWALVLQIQAARADAQEGAE